MTTRPKLKVAIFSFEHMHAFSYAAAFENLDTAELVAVADPDTERLAKVRGDFPFIPAFYADYQALLEHSEVDAVIIATPNSDHKDVALLAAKHGKHILCEKPLATNLEDCETIIKAAQSAGVKLMTAFPVRFSPAAIAARRMVQEGELGKVLGICSSNHGTMPGGWFVQKEKSGGGAVIDHTVHVVDALRWILDDEVAAVYAEYGTRLHELDVEDVGQLLLTFRKGTVLSLDTSWSRPASFPIWGDVKLDFKGTKANLAVNCFPQQIHHYDDSTMRHSGFDAGANLDLLMIEEFLAAIQEDREPLITGEDGMRAVQVALAAYISGEQHQPVWVGRG